MSLWLNVPKDVLRVDCSRGRPKGWLFLSNISSSFAHCGSGNMILICIFIFSVFFGAPLWGIPSTQHVFDPVSASTQPGVRTVGSRNASLLECLLKVRAYISVLVVNPLHPSWDMRYQLASSISLFFCQMLSLLSASNSVWWFFSRLCAVVLAFSFLVVSSLKLIFVFYRSAFLTHDLASKVSPFDLRCSVICYV